MTKTTDALREELEGLKNNLYEMNKEFGEKLYRETVRINRIVQVLLNNLSEEQLNKIVSFNGFDCHGIYRRYSDGYFDDTRITLKEFLNDVVDP